MSRLLRVALVSVVLLAGACASSTPKVEPIPTSTIPDLAFTDTTPIDEPPTLDEGAALTCLNLRDGLDALDEADLATATSALSAASLYIASTSTPGFAEHVSALVIFATSPGDDRSSLEPLNELCNSVITS